MARYTTIDYIERKVSAIKYGLKKWALECFDSGVTFGPVAIGVEQNGILRFSLPYRVEIESGQEQRYWTEEL